MRVNIKIESDEIENGIQKSARYCPVGRGATKAFKDIMPDWEKWMTASVDYHSIYLPDGSSIKFPYWVGEAISIYDAHGTMQPFQFEVEWEPKE